jgi:phosphatidylglycerophosphate synthase
METRIAAGRFLDPLADKALVIATLIIFILLDQAVPLWMVIVIILRDMLVTLMRYLAIRKGAEIRTTRLGKAKTMFQMFSIGAILIIFVIRSFHFDIPATYAEGRAQGKKNFEIASTMMVKAFQSFESSEIPKEERNKYFAESVPYFLLLDHHFANHHLWPALHVFKLARIAATLYGRFAQTAKAHSHTMKPVRFVTATALFDGHDASINIIRRFLQREGAEVVHLGHNRPGA